MSETKTTPKVASPEMFNAIRSEASQSYKDNVPEATTYNLTDVGNPILKYEAVGNEFISALVNKIVIQLIDNRLWRNPLGILKRDMMPLGSDVEDIHINPVEAEEYDGTETGMADLLKMHRPDVATVYYRLNRKEKYPLTIENDALRGAFTSWPKMENFLTGLVDSIYNGATIDEFKHTKALVSGAIAANQMIVQTTPMPIDEATGKQFMKIMRGLSLNFTFPSSTYNSYATISGGKARISFSAIEDQIILIRGDVASAVGVDVLSGLFNLNYGDYLTRQIIVDNFNDDKTLAVIADRRAFVIMEQLRKFTTFYNGSSLNWQYFYHTWDLYSMSPFHNCVALQTP